jgi:nicotinamidase-related amidase
MLRGPVYIRLTASPSGLSTAQYCAVCVNSAAIAAASPVFHAAAQRRKTRGKSSPTAAAAEAAGNAPNTPPQIAARDADETAPAPHRVCQGRSKVQAVDPEQTPIARTTLNSWEDERVIEWVQETGKQKLVFAALWTEICLQFPVLSALGDGYEVYFITDASGGTTREAHDMAVQRMIQAGAVPDTLSAYGGSLIRDWARPLPPEFEEISAQHGGILATDSQWERDLLFADPPEWMAQTH